MVLRNFLFSRRYSRKTCVVVVNNDVDTVSAQSKTKRTWTRLRGYFLKTLNASHRTQRYNQAKQVTWMQISVSKEKIACSTTRTCDFRMLVSNIFTKTKKFAKWFLPVHMRPRSNLLSKKVRKSRYIVSLICQLESEIGQFSEKVGV